MHSRNRFSGRTKTHALLALAALGALALLIAPSAASAARKTLKLKVETKSQTQALNRGALKVSFKSKGLDRVSATAKASPSGGSQVNFASKDQKSSARGTLTLPLTAAGENALADCASLRVRVQAKGKPKKNAKASAMLAEDDPVCAEPVKEFDLESSAAYPMGIDVGPDDALWFTQIGAGANSVGRLTTAGDYDRVHIPVPPGTPPGALYGHVVNDIVAGADGALWASPENGSGGSAFLRRIDPATQEVTAFDMGPYASVGSKIAVGPDGALWMTNQSPAELTRVTTSGDVTSFPLSDPAFPEIFPSPYGLAIGGDGAVWFTTPDAISSGTAGAAVGRLDPETGETQLFPLSDPTKALGYMTTDRAGRLWFTTPFGNTIGRIDPTSGQVVEFQIPTADSKPIGIAFANDGSLWFTEQNADNIGRYDPASGTFTEYPLGTLGSLPFDIVEGPDGKIYFTEMGTGRVGQLDPAKAPTGAPNPSDGQSLPPFAQQGRCPAGALICQQQVNVSGSTFQIGTALTQELPPETLKLTAGIIQVPAPMEPPVSGPMLESTPLDVEVGGQQAVTRIGLAGPPTLNSLIPIDVTVPIDLYVSQPGNPEGGCVIGPIIQDLAADEDPEGDLGAILAGDSTMGGVSGRTGNFAIVGTGTLTADAFEVPAARGCGALTTVINTLLGLPSPSGANSTSLPFSQFITGFGG
jgi:virginiamycin B lyase